MPCSFNLASNEMFVKISSLFQCILKERFTPSRSIRLELVLKEPFLHPTGWIVQSNIDMTHPLDI